MNLALPRRSKPRLRSLKAFHARTPTIGAVHVSQAMKVVGCATRSPARLNKSARTADRSRGTQTGETLEIAAARAMEPGRMLIDSRLGYRTPKSIIRSGNAPSEADAMPAASATAEERPMVHLAAKTQPRGQNTAARTMLVRFTATGTSSAKVEATKVATAFQPAG